PAREAILVDAAELRRRRLRNLGGNRPLQRYIPARVEQQARQSKMLGEQPALLNFRFGDDDLKVFSGSLGLHGGSFRGARIVSRRVETRQGEFCCRPANEIRGIMPRFSRPGVSLRQCPMSLPHNTNGLSVSIVMTLSLTRGKARESIESWTTRQNFPRERIELIVVSNGADPSLEDSVRAKLSDQDRLLLLDSKNEMELYDFGARACRAPWILFTEAHVFATRDCLARLWQYLEETGLDGACVRTLPTHEHQWVARVEARMYLEDAAIWTREGDWRKFTKRGFIVRRAAYEAVGRLDYQYLWFAEMAIAARLHAGGFRLGFAPEATVIHDNTAELTELLDYAWEYRRQACAFEEDHPGLIPGGNDFRDSLTDPLVMKTMVKCARNTFRSALGRLGTSGGRLLAWTMLTAGFQGWLEHRLGRLGSRERSRLRYWMARLRLTLARRHPDARYRAFMRVWQSLGDYAVETYLYGRRNGRTPAPLSNP